MPRLGFVPTITLGNLPAFCSTRRPRFADSLVLRSVSATAYFRSGWSRLAHRAQEPVLRFALLNYAGHASPCGVHEPFCFDLPTRPSGLLRLAQWAQGPVLRFALLNYAGHASPCGVHEPFCFDLPTRPSGLLRLAQWAKRGGI